MEDDEEVAVSDFAATDTSADNDVPVQARAHVQCDYCVSSNENVLSWHLMT